MSGFFDEPPPSRPRAATAAPPPQRSRALLLTGLVLVAAFFVVSIFTGIWTDRLWFRSVDYGSVFTKMLSTRVVLFAFFPDLSSADVSITTESINLRKRGSTVSRPSSRATPTMGSRSPCFR